MSSLVWLLLLSRGCVVCCRVLRQRERTREEGRVALGLDWTVSVLALCPVCCVASREDERRRRGKGKRKKEEGKGGDLLLFRSLLVFSFFVAVVPMRSRRSRVFSLSLCLSVSSCQRSSFSFVLSCVVASIGRSAVFRVSSRGRDARRQHASRSPQEPRELVIISSGRWCLNGKEGG